MLADCDPTRLANCGGSMEGLRGTEEESGVRGTGFGIPALPLPACDTLGELLNLSEPWSPHP